MKYYSIKVERRFDPAREHDWSQVFAYGAYIRSVGYKLPKELKRLCSGLPEWSHTDVSLTHADLTRITFNGKMQQVDFTFSGAKYDIDCRELNARLIRLHYHGVRWMVSNGEGDHSRGAGYGEFCFDEIEVLHDGYFEHRILLTTGIELKVIFKDITIETVELDDWPPIIYDDGHGYINIKQVEFGGSGI